YIRFCGYGLCVLRLKNSPGATVSESLKKKHRFMWRNLILPGLVLVGIVSYLLFFYSRTVSSNEIKNILLISIDTCRADHVSCYGYPRQTTPNIDQLARESVLFKNVITPVPITLPAHCSMLIGTIPPHHGVHDNVGYRLHESNLTLAEILHTHGYTTGAILSSFVMDARFGLDQGFEVYDDFFGPAVSGYYSNERRAENASRLTCAWLEEHQNEPFFLFLHYFDPHFPYDPPEPFASAFADDLYAGEIAYTDKYIHQVIEKLKELDLYDSTLLIITSDHGEGLYEHSEWTHGYFIYHSTIQVPLIIKVPGGPRGKKVDGVVGLVDIVPTICGMLGITPPSPMHGQDLSPILTKKRKIKKDERYVYCESLMPSKRYGCSPLLGLVSDRWKYIQAPRQELYDLNKDPDEIQNLADENPAVVRLMRNNLRFTLEDTLRTNRPDSRSVLDSESRKRLESLGYIAVSGISEDFEFDDTKDDPKDWIRLHVNLNAALHFLKIGDYTKAQAWCNQIIAEQPKYILNSYLLGKIAIGRNNIAKSIVRLEKFLSQIDEISDDKLLAYVEMYVADAHSLLGFAFAQQERFDNAARHYWDVLKIDPDSAETHYNLGNTFFKQDKLNDAVEHYIKALDLNPNLPDAHYSLGNSLLQQEKFDQAITHYREALKLKPDWQGARLKLEIAETRKDQNEKVKSPWLR
ncbi:MAG: sulfatase-like hydrolase/transferase, partial [Planctomycetota bacterium]